MCCLWMWFSHWLNRCCSHWIRTSGSSLFHRWVWDTSTVSQGIHSSHNSTKQSEKLLWAMLWGLKQIYIIEGLVVTPKTRAEEAHRDYSSFSCWGTAPPLPTVCWEMLTTTWDRTSSLLDFRSSIQCGNAYIPNIKLYVPQVHTNMWGVCCFPKEESSLKSTSPSFLPASFSAEKLRNGRSPQVIACCSLGFFDFQLHQHPSLQWAEWQHSFELLWF